MAINNNNKIKVAVGMSGGVDSSVTALLLKNEGYDVTGVFMQCWNEKADGCRADEDRSDAVKVASMLDIPFVSLDFIQEYNNKVIDYFYKEYQAGRTPNPDIMCNKEIKFGMFLGWALEQGFDFVATGHYARIINEDGQYKLLKGVDESKDQSYFLYLLSQEELSKTMFPIGSMKKLEIRKIAENAKLPTFNKPDSTGICFIGEVDIKEFLKKRIEPVQGNVLNTSGEVIGVHEGAAYYTIGQRHGFTINKYVGTPLYVVSKNAELNEIVVGTFEEAKSDLIMAGEVHWVSRVSPDFPGEFDVRIRHLGELHQANVDLVGENLQIKLHKPVFGVAPGQSAVLYNGSELLGGGVIL